MGVNDASVNNQESISTKNFEALKQELEKFKNGSFALDKVQQYLETIDFSLPEFTTSYLAKEIPVERWHFLGQLISKLNKNNEQKILTIINKLWPQISETIQGKELDKLKQAIAKHFTSLTQNAKQAKLQEWSQLPETNPLKSYALYELARFHARYNVGVKEKLTGDKRDKHLTKAIEYLCNIGYPHQLFFLETIPSNQNFQAENWVSIAKRSDQRLEKVLETQNDRTAFFEIFGKTIYNAIPNYLDSEKYNTPAFLQKTPQVKKVRYAASAYATILAFGTDEQAKKAATQLTSVLVNNLSNTDMLKEIAETFEHLSKRIPEERFEIVLPVIINHAITIFNNPSSELSIANNMLNVLIKFKDHTILIPNKDLISFAETYFHLSTHRERIDQLNSLGGFGASPENSPKTDVFRTITNCQSEPIKQLAQQFPLTTNSLNLILDEVPTSIKNNPKTNYSTHVAFLFEQFYKFHLNNNPVLIPVLMRTATLPYEPTKSQAAHLLALKYCRLTIENATEQAIKYLLLIHNEYNNQITTGIQLRALNKKETREILSVALQDDNILKLIRLINLNLLDSEETIITLKTEATKNLTIAKKTLLNKQLHNLLTNNQTTPEVVSAILDKLSFVEREKSNILMQVYKSISFDECKTALDHLKDKENCGLQRRVLLTLLLQQNLQGNNESEDNKVGMLAETFSEDIMTLLQPALSGIVESELNSFTEQNLLALAKNERYRNYLIKIAPLRARIIQHDPKALISEINETDKLRRERTSSVGSVRSIPSGLMECNPPSEYEESLSDDEFAEATVPQVTNFSTEEIIQTILPGLENKKIIQHVLYFLLTKRLKIEDSKTTIQLLLNYEAYLKAILMAKDKIVIRSNDTTSIFDTKKYLFECYFQEHDQLLLKNDTKILQLLISSLSFSEFISIILTYKSNNLSQLIFDQYFYLHPNLNPEQQTKFKELYTELHPFCMAFISNQNNSKETKQKFAYDILDNIDCYKELATESENTLHSLIRFYITSPSGCATLPEVLDREQHHKTTSSATERGRSWSEVNKIKGIQSQIYESLKSQGIISKLNRIALTYINEDNPEAIRKMLHNLSLADVLILINSNTNEFVLDELALYISNNPSLRKRIYDQFIVLKETDGDQPSQALQKLSNFILIHRELLLNIENPDTLVKHFLECYHGMITTFVLNQNTPEDVREFLTIEIIKQQGYELSKKFYFNGIIDSILRQKKVTTGFSSQLSTILASALLLGISHNIDEKPNKLVRVLEFVSNDEKPKLIKALFDNSIQRNREDGISTKLDQNETELIALAQEWINTGDPQLNDLLRIFDAHQDMPLLRTKVLTSIFTSDRYSTGLFNAIKNKKHPNHEHAYGVLYQFEEHLNSRNAVCWNIVTQESKETLQLLKHFIRSDISAHLNTEVKNILKQKYVSLDKTLYKGKWWRTGSIIRKRNKHNLLRRKNRAIAAKLLKEETIASKIKDAQQMKTDVSNLNTQLDNVHTGCSHQLIADQLGMNQCFEQLKPLIFSLICYVIKFQRNYDVKNLMTPIQVNCSMTKKLLDNLMKEHREEIKAFQKQLEQEEETFTRAMRIDEKTKAFIKELKAEEGIEPLLQKFKSTAARTA